MFSFVVVVLELHQTLTQLCAQVCTVSLCLDYWNVLGCSWRSGVTVESITVKTMYCVWCSKELLKLASSETSRVGITLRFLRDHSPGWTDSAQPWWWQHTSQVGNTCFFTVTLMFLSRSTWFCVCTATYVSTSRCQRYTDTLQQYWSQTCRLTKLTSVLTVCV